jgi:hypothetical protein
MLEWRRMVNPAPAPPEPAASEPAAANRPALDPARYAVAGYAGFRRRAVDPTLTGNEKSGFAEIFRQGYSEAILADIAGKLTQLAVPGARVCDIGAGCSDLAHLIVETTGRKRQSLTVVDCPEMLALLSSPPHVTKIAGPFPDCCATATWAGARFDAVLVYSVLQTVFGEASLFAFVDAAAGLLAAGGQLLLGDIPNATMRRRFIASPAGKGYHRRHYPHLPEPSAAFNAPAPGEIDDGVVLGLLGRLRAAGLHAFVVPQAPTLPMATRREDIFVVRP